MPAEERACPAPGSGRGIGGGRPRRGATGLRPVGRAAQADRNARPQLPPSLGGARQKLSRRGPPGLRRASTCRRRMSRFASSSNRLTLPPPRHSIRELTKLMTTVGQLPPVQKRAPRVRRVVEETAPVGIGRSIETRFERRQRRHRGSDVDRRAGPAGPRRRRDAEVKLGPKAARMSALRRTAGSPALLSRKAAEPSLCSSV